jgi:hypothetical protein
LESFYGLCSDINESSPSRSASPRTSAFLEDEVDQEQLVQLKDDLKASFYLGFIRKPRKTGGD